tara:strand:- start:705 stop:1118 length:414 start_codon:yes stop_codon:yes gene_type:complete
LPYFFQPFLLNNSYLRDLTISKLGRINEKDLTKLYYSIGEVARMFDVNTSLIRFWEKEFTTVNPKKNKKGNRLFTPKDVVKVDRIYELVKEKGYTLDGAKKALKSKVDIQIEETSTNQSSVILRLENLKSSLLQLKS